MPTPQRPLDNVRVLAVEQALAGPYGSQILSAFGADVIRVERPDGGELYRVNPPYVENERGRTGYGLIANNLNKRSIILDLKQPAAQDVFRRLAQSVDVVWENNRPGVMDRLGLGYPAIREVNPRIIYVSVSGFGQPATAASPYSDWPAFDIVAQAMGGLMMRAGKPGGRPVYNCLPLGDQYPSVLAVIGCLMALRWRDQTGEGQQVDIAMYDAAATLASLYYSQWTFDPGVLLRGTAGTSAPWDAFACADGYFVLAIGGDAIWRRFCSVIGRPDLPDDPRLQTGVDRARQTDLLQEIIEDWARERPLADIVPTFVAAGVPCAPVQDLADLTDCPHLRARGTMVEVNDPVAGTKSVLGIPIHLSAAPPPRTDPPPQLGQHTDEVLAELAGLSAGEIQRLRAEGAVA